METDAPGPDLKHHLVTVTPENFVAKSNLQEHISSQYEVTPKLVKFQCSECFANKQLTKVFSKQSLLKQHIHNCHGQHRFKCEVCFKAFPKPSILKIHQRTHSVGKIKCDLCAQTLQTTAGLQRHLFRVHKQKTEGCKYSKCEFCAREFFNGSKLENHVIDKHIVDKKFTCPVCSKTFIDPEALGKHLTGHDKRESFVCDVCSKEYQQRTGLRNHLKLQHDKFFNCFKCCRSFSNKVEFDEHNGSKTSTLQFKCEICLENFHSRCNLDIHTNYHLKEIEIKEKEKPQMKSTPNKHQIDGNVKTTLPKSTQEELVQLHTCDLCQQTFDRESRFRLHRVLVHANAIWKCNFEQCSKSFICYSKLKRHKSTHSACRRSNSP